MRLLLLFYVNFCYAVNIHFFFRTSHPDVPFHQKRLDAAKADLKRQIDEFKLSKSVRIDSLSSGDEYYSNFLVMNALPGVKKRIKSDVDWIFIGEETTHVVLDRLVEHLEAEFKIV